MSDRYQDWLATDSGELAGDWCPDCDYKICVCEEHGDDGTRKVDMPYGEEWIVHACLCGEKFVDISELWQHINDQVPVSAGEPGYTRKGAAAVASSEQRETVPLPLKPETA